MATTSKKSGNEKTRKPRKPATRKAAGAEKRPARKSAANSKKGTGNG